jgi:hypothetical protein
MTTSNAPAPKEVAALLVIGDKILSGRASGKIGAAIRCRRRALCRLLCLRDAPEYTPCR